MGFTGKKNPTSGWEVGGVFEIRIVYLVYTTSRVKTAVLVGIVTTEHYSPVASNKTNTAHHRFDHGHRAQLGRKRGCFTCL